jgi:hypothetical protein
MATIVQEIDNDAPGSGFAFLAAGSLTFTAGNLIAAFVKFEGVSSTVTISGFTPATKQANPAPDSWGQWFYKLSATGGALDVTANFSPATNFPSIFVYEINASGVWTLDTEATANGSSTAPDSGAMTVAGPEGVAFGGYAEISGLAVSAALINGAAADRTDTVAPNATVAWAKVHAAGFTGSASCTISSSESWACCGIAFKAAAGGGPGAMLQSQICL